MTSDLASAWAMSNESNLFLLAQLGKDHLAASMTARTRSVADQFTHMHDVRVRWLKHAAPKDATGLEPFGKDTPRTKAALKKALRASEAHIGAYLDSCEEAGQVKGWDGPPASFLAYLVAHEAHHRGLILATLRAAGYRVPQEVVYGLWQWGMKRNLRGSR